MIDESEPTERDGEAGAENPDSDAADALPGAPAQDKDAPAGDTDQHSSSDA